MKKPKTSVGEAWKREIAKRVRETLEAGDAAPGDEWPIVRARLERKLRTRRR